VNIRAATPADLQAIERILSALDLPSDDCANHISNFVVAEAADQIVGTGGLEQYGNVALLRSIAVVKEQRGRGLGDTLYSTIKSAAQSHGAQELYLLTETAETYFEARGFTVVDRENVPRDIKNTEQFSGLCPESATVMRLSL